MKQWPWYIAVDCDYFHVLRSQPELGRELEETTYGDLVPGFPFMVRCYTVAHTLSGTIYAEWGDGRTSTLVGFCSGPGLGNEDLTLIPPGRVYYKAMTDDVDFVCVKPKTDGLCLEQDIYHGPEALPGWEDSYVVVLRGEVTIDGKKYGVLDAIHDASGAGLVVNATPDAVFTHVRRRDV